MEYCLGLSRHEEILFRTIINDLRKCDAEDMIFNRLFELYKSKCFSKGLAPLSTTAAFKLIMEIAR